VTTASPPPRHERTLRVLLRGTLASALAPIVVLSLSPPAVASGILPGGNPPANVAPTPDFMSSGKCANLDGTWSCVNPCISGRLRFPMFTENPACTSFVLSAIDTARSAEHVGPMVLPTNWSKLNVTEQLFVLADLERTARGLPPYVGINRHLNADAQAAAERDDDPTLAPGFTVGLDLEGYYGMGSTWSSGFSALVADYFWMYDDGWGGSRAHTFNLACSSSESAGCWAHRDELLGFDPRFNPGVGLLCRTCEMGVGFAVTDGFSSYADLIELPGGKTPPMIFSWARNVVPYLVHPSSTVFSVKPVVPIRDAVHGAWTPWSSKAASACSTSRAPQRFAHAACRKTLHPGRHLAVPANQEEQ
jgi:hypothetical protein